MDESNEDYSGLGMKTTLIFIHANGICPSAIHAVKILFKDVRMRAIPSWSMIGYIRSRSVNLETKKKISATLAVKLLGVTKITTERGVFGQNTLLLW